MRVARIRSSRGVLEQEPRRAGGQRGGDGLVVVEGRQDEHRRGVVGWRTRRVASAPSMRFIRTSMRITSGAWAATGRLDLVAVRALAHDLQIGLGPRMRTNPARTNG